MTGDLRLGLVGCGRLAEAGYVPAMRAAAGVRLVAVADPDPTRRVLVGRLAADGGEPVRAFASAAALLDSEPVDGVVLASPAHAHLDDAALATAVGVAVLVEKPPAPDGPTAARLAALDPAPWVGFNRRFDPGVAAVRAAVPAGAHVDLRLSIAYRRRSWAAHTVHDDVLLDLGPHLVDLARWLGGGEIVEVRATGVTPDRARLELTMTGGRAIVTAAADRRHAERIDARDATGARVGRHRTGGPAAAVGGRLRPPPEHPLVASLRAQVQAFARAAAGDAVPELGTASDGRAAMVTIDAARASAAGGGRPVAVAEPVGT